MDLDQALDQLARDPQAPLDVAELALCLARDEYPDLDVAAYLSELDAMAHEAQAYVRGRLPARVAGLCRYLFHEMGFRGNAQDYYNPRNCYLNEVLDRRTGLPISLSTVAMAIGVRAGLDVVGVGLPGHFVVKAVAGEEEILFDPFHGGRKLTRADCEMLVQQLTKMSFEATTANMRALPLGLMAVRMLANLKAIYLRQKDFRRAVRVLERLLQLTPHDPVQQRDLGISLLRTERPGPAIDHLTAYLAAVPDGKDSGAVRALLQQARGEVARWN
jgi:regulator of sirC expression with transglutaminase-like and TPR domain